MKKLPSFKMGDTFALGCTYKSSGVPADVTDITIRSDVVTKNGVLVASLDVDKNPDQVANPGMFSLKATASATATWAAGEHYIDIEFTQNGYVRSTETFSVEIIEDITKWN
jgi:hypothetical protein